MDALKGSLKIISLLTMTVSLFVFNGQIFAASTLSLASPARCLLAPKIQAPPRLSTSASRNAQRLRSICAAGLVPQPVGGQSTGPQQSTVPVHQVNSLQVSSNGFHYVDATQNTTSIGASGS